MTTSIPFIGCLVAGTGRELPAYLRSVLPDVSLQVGDTIEALLSTLPQLNGLVVSTQLYTPAVARLLTEQAPALRWLQVLSTGTDAVLATGVPPGVALTSAAGAHAVPVAEHAMALLLALHRQIPTITANQASGRWDAAALVGGLREIEGSRAVVVGYGHIGQAIAKRLRAFAVHVTAVNRSGLGPGPGDTIVPIAALASALRGAHILILALPAAPGAPVIGPAELALLDPGGVIVNVGRGSALDQDALLESLRQGRLAGAGLDVFATEPLPAGHPFWAMPNVIVSPHVAGNGALVPHRLNLLVAENLRRFLADEPLLNVVIP